jgi:hypothetical protein
MVKYHQHAVKYGLLEAKDRSNTEKKNQGKIEPFLFDSFFRGLSFYNVDCRYI